MQRRVAGHQPFSLVLGGGGARGYAHLGVLRGLEALGYRPTALVGVSMGALVASAYSLREDWYDVVLSADTAGFPGPGNRGRRRGPRTPRVRGAVGRARVVWNMVTGWGAPERAVAAGQRLLAELFADKRLEEGRLPVVVCATDLLTGARVEITSGLARDAVYASAALAGIVPPLEMDGYLLVDGVYTDISPVDVARALDPPVVIAVDPTQHVGATEIHNGVQAVMRAVEICHERHAALRFREADLTIRPDFPSYIDTLDFESRRICVAAGIRAARSGASELRDLLGPPHNATGMVRHDRR